MGLGWSWVGVVVYLALPWEVIFFITASVQRDEEVCARVSVGDGEFGVGHLGAGGACEVEEGGSVIGLCLVWVCVFAQ